jgi:N-acetyl sugar amidotransferase
MDTSDPDITFDECGICNHCVSYEAMAQTSVFSGETGRRKLDEIVTRIKEQGKGKQYDCVIGVSGGVDSTFVAYKVKQMGLRPLAVHLDNGWNSELAIQNIEKTLKGLEIDLYTYVIDWEEFKDIQLSFLKAGTPDLEIPTDHAILALLNKTAHERGIRTVIWGFNVRTETHVPAAWSQGHSDWRYIREIHRRFGRVPMKTFPHLTIWSYLGWHQRGEQLNILNYVDYVKKDAMKVLERELGWRYYGGKHYESLYTRFYQGYFLPRRFGFDKRKAHLSSLICSGEITRDEALEELKRETYPLDLQEQDKRYVIKKFGLTEQEFETLMTLPKKRFTDYPSFSRFIKDWQYSLPHNIYRFFKYRVLGLLASASWLPG